MNPPLYEHDCKTCTFLGRFNPPVENAADLYICERTKTLWIPLARFSSSSSDFISGLEQVSFNIWIREAARRAIHRGMIDPEQVYVNTRAGPRAMLPLVLELKYSAVTDALDGTTMLQSTITAIQGIGNDMCPFCKSLEGERLCFQQDNRYCCTRPFSHSGEHVACGGAEHHIVSHWRTKTGLEKLYQAEADIRK